MSLARIIGGSLMDDAVRMLRRTMNNSRNGLFEGYIRESGSGRIANKLTEGSTRKTFLPSPEGGPQITKPSTPSSPAQSVWVGPRRGPRSTGPLQGPRPSSFEAIVRQVENVRSLDELRPLVRNSIPMSVSDRPQDRDRMLSALSRVRSRFRDVLKSEDDQLELDDLVEFASSQFEPYYEKQATEEIFGDVLDFLDRPDVRERLSPAQLLAARRAVESTRLTYIERSIARAKSFKEIDDLFRGLASQSLSQREIRGINRAIRRVTGVAPNSSRTALPAENPDDIALRAKLIAISEDMPDWAAQNARASNELLGLTPAQREIAQKEAEEVRPYVSVRRWYRTSDDLAYEDRLDLRDQLNARDADAAELSYLVRDINNNRLSILIKKIEDKHGELFDENGRRILSLSAPDKLAAFDPNDLNSTRRLAVSVAQSKGDPLARRPLRTIEWSEAAEYLGFSKDDQITMVTVGYGRDALDRIAASELGEDAVAAVKKASAPKPAQSADTGKSSKTRIGPITLVRSQAETFESVAPPEVRDDILKLSEIHDALRRSSSADDIERYQALKEALNERVRKAINSPSDWNSLVADTLRDYSSRLSSRTRGSVSFGLERWGFPEPPAGGGLGGSPVRPRTPSQPSGSGSSEQPTLGEFAERSPDVPITPPPVRGASTWGQGDTAKFNSIYPSGPEHKTGTISDESFKLALLGALNKLDSLSARLANFKALRNGVYSSRDLEHVRDAYREIANTLPVSSPGWVKREFRFMVQQSLETSLGISVKWVDNAQPSLRRRGTFPRRTRSSGTVSPEDAGPEYRPLGELDAPGRPPGPSVDD